MILIYMKSNTKEDQLNEYDIHVHPTKYVIYIL